MKSNMQAIRSMVTTYKGYRNDAEYYNANKAAIEREIKAVQECVDWNANAIRILGQCAS